MSVVSFKTQDEKSQDLRAFIVLLQIHMTENERPVAEQKGLEMGNVGARYRHLLKSQPRFDLIFQPRP